MRPYIRQAVATVTTSALVLGGAMAWGVESGGNPYADIVTRNAFGLKPPEPPKELPPPVEDKAPSNIIMTGVTSIGGKKQVYLKITTPGEKEPEYIHLGENERQGAIEVVEITPKTGRVRIKNRGVPSLISFETHGAMASVAAAAPAVPGRPGMPALPTVPGVAPVSANNSVSARPITTSSTIPVSPGNTGIRPSSTSNGSVIPNLPTSTQQNPTRSIPTRPLRLNPSGGGASYQAPAAVQDINPAAQAVQIEVNRVVQPADFPPLPPTPLTEAN